MKLLKNIMSLCALLLFLAPLDAQASTVDRGQTWFNFHYSYGLLDDAVIVSFGIRGWVAYSDLDGLNVTGGISRSRTGAVARSSSDGLIGQKLHIYGSHFDRFLYSGGVDLTFGSNGLPVDWRISIRSGTDGSDYYEFYPGGGVLYLQERYDPIFLEEGVWTSDRSYYVVPLPAGVILLVTSILSLVGLRSWQNKRSPNVATWSRSCSAG